MRKCIINIYSGFDLQSYICSAHYQSICLPQSGKLSITKILLLLDTLLDINMISNLIL